MNNSSFFIKDCCFSLLSTGKTASSLLEMKEILQTIDPKSLFYHFCANRLRTTFAHLQYHNDFARWARHSLKDDLLTEKLAIIDPTDYVSLEELRKKTIQIIEQHLETKKFPDSQLCENSFHFLYPIFFVYNRGVEAKTPRELKPLLPLLTPSSIFYHFIDARWRTPDGSNDFIIWLSGFGNTFSDLIHEIKKIDVYFSSSAEIKKRLNQLAGKFL